MRYRTDPMKIDHARLGELVSSICDGPLTLAEAETIMAVAQLAVDVDGTEDADEIATFFALGKLLSILAGSADAATPTFASDEDDDERLHTLAAQLDRTVTRELAFAAAHIMTLADVAIAREEDAFIYTLRAALSIDEFRAGEIAFAVGNLR